MNFQNSRRQNLAANFYPANSNNSDAIVIMVHGFISDKISSGRFDYIAKCLNAAGYNAFAFDFSGCGESDDDTLTCAKHIDDLQSAIAFVFSLGYKRLALWGAQPGQPHMLAGLLPRNYYYSSYRTDTYLCCICCSYIC